MFEFEDLKFYFLLFSYGQAGRDDSRTPEQQQYPVQSTGQAVHTEDPGPAPSKIHKPEKQQRQRRRQSDPGERNDPRAFLTFHRKQETQTISAAAKCLNPAGVLHYGFTVPESQACNRQVIN